MPTEHITKPNKKKAKQHRATTHKPKVYAVCTRCTEIKGEEHRHHPFATCVDGSSLKARRFTAENNPRKRVEPVADQGEPEQIAVAPRPEVISAVEDLRAQITLMPEGSPQRKSFELLLAREEARIEHAEREGALQADSGRSDARRPLPTILRDPSEAKGRALNREMDRLIAQAGMAQDPRSRPPREEAALVHDTITGLGDRRQAAATAAAEAAKPPARIPGEQMWQCQNDACGVKFRSLTIDEAKKKGRMEPDWKGLRCPGCGGNRVLALMLAAA